MMVTRPPDYEACGDCGVDHAYEPAEAAAYHNARPGSYDVQVIRANYRDVVKEWLTASLSLVVTDPPYGGIVKEGWDVAQ